MEITVSKSSLLRRLLGGFAVAWLVGGGAIVAVAPGVSAVEWETVTYVVGEETETHVDVVMAPTPDAFGFGGFNKPGSCAKASWCTEVPIEFVPGPGGSTADDYLVRLTVDWEAEDVHVEEEGPYNQEVEEEASTNDPDIYLWEYRAQFDEDGEPVVDDDGEQTYKWEEVNRSGSLARPERMLLYSLYGDYVLTVNNYYGANTGFRVIFDEYRAVAGFEDSFSDDGAPAPAPPPSSSTPAPADPAPSGNRAALGPSPGPSPSFPPAPSPAPETIPPPESFSVTGGSLETALQGAEETRGSLFDKRDLGPPEPVSMGVAALWLGGVPLALLSGAAALLMRYRPATLAFATSGRRGGDADADVDETVSSSE